MRALQKIRHHLDLAREVTSEPNEGKAVYTETTALGGNRQYITILIRAINGQQQITFDYLKHEGERTKFYVLHPLKLPDVHDSWYLIVYDEKAQKEKTFGLDRISHLAFTEQANQVPERILTKVNELFHPIYGITDSDLPVEDIWLSLRSYGPEMKILRPLSLVAAFARDLEATMARYK